EHLDTIPATESDEVIKSSVEDLVPIPNEFEENIEYVEASPNDSELVSLEAAEIVILEVEEIENDNLREKLELPDPGELMSVLNSGIRENLPSATSVNL
nr:hypothetical protein [Tanacetum cinerariifolium]